MASPSIAYFELEDHGPITVVRMLAETIRHPNQAEELSSELGKVVEQGGYNRLVIDLRKTHYLCSTAYGVLLGLAKKIDAAHGKLALCHMHPDVRVGANILSLGTFIPIFDDEKSALAAV